ncbi:MAG: hypothetical protein HWE25_09075 [Alphaproteobacteria bacterium]|nr:hypothetical protein [Alphaproteobacteria bacterium]
MKLAEYFKGKMEMVMSLSAILVAIVAVVVAMYEADINREQARLAVQPSLWMAQNWGVQDENVPYFSLEIRNLGLGPAIVENFTVKYKGRYFKNWDAYLQAVTDGKKIMRGDDANVRDWSMSTIDPGRVIPAGDSVVPIHLRGDREVVDAMRIAFTSSELTICFCSFYGECWQATGLGGRPEPVNRCLYKEEEFFNQ